jgi:hypothetical protein
MSCLQRQVEQEEPAAKKSKTSTVATATNSENEENLPSNIPDLLELPTSIMRSGDPSLEVRHWLRRPPGFFLLTCTSVLVAGYLTLY